MSNDLDKIVEDQLCAHSNILRTVTEQIKGGNWGEAEISLQELYADVESDGCRVCMDLMDSVMTNFQSAKASPTLANVQEVQDSLDFVVQAFCP